MSQSNSSSIVSLEARNCGKPQKTKHRPKRPDKISKKTKYRQNTTRKHRSSVYNTSENTKGLPTGVEVSVFTLNNSVSTSLDETNKNKKTNNELNDSIDINQTKAFPVKRDAVGKRGRTDRHRKRKKTNEALRNTTRKSIDENDAVDLSNNERILGYWNIRGQAEAIRYILKYLNLPFFDKRYNFGPEPEHDQQEWLNDKANFHCSSLPYFIEGDVCITQTIAILRFIARNNNLFVVSKAARSQQDFMEQNVVELCWSLGRVVFSVTYEESRKKFLGILPFTLKPFCTTLENNNWLLGNSLTYVDFLFYETLDWIRLFANTDYEDMPELADYCNRFESLNGIKEYVKNRSVFPIFGPYAKWGNYTTTMVVAAGGKGNHPTSSHLRKSNKKLTPKKDDGFNKKCDAESNTQRSNQRSTRTENDTSTSDGGCKSNNWENVPQSKNVKKQKKQKVPLKAHLSSSDTSSSTNKHIHRKITQKSDDQTTESKSQVAANIQRPKHIKKITRVSAYINPEAFALYRTPMSKIPVVEKKSVPSIDNTFKEAIKSPQIVPANNPIRSPNQRPPIQTPVQAPIQRTAAPPNESSCFSFFCRPFKALNDIQPNKKTEQPVASPAGKLDKTILLSSPKPRSPGVKDDKQILQNVPMQIIKPDEQKQDSLLLRNKLQRNNGGCLCGETQTIEKPAQPFEVERICLCHETNIAQSQQMHPVQALRPVSLSLSPPVCCCMYHHRPPGAVIPGGYNQNFPQQFGAVSPRPIIGTLLPMQGGAVSPNPMMSMVVPRQLPAQNQRLSLILANRPVAPDAIPNVQQAGGGQPALQPRTSFTTQQKPRSLSLFCCCKSTTADQTNTDKKL